MSREALVVGINYNLTETLAQQFRWPRGRAKLKIAARVETGDDRGERADG